MFKKLPNPGDNIGLFESTTRLGYDPNWKELQGFLLGDGRKHIFTRLADEERQIEIYKLQGALQLLNDIERLFGLSEKLYQTLVAKARKPIT